MKKVHFIGTNRPKSRSLAIFSDNEARLRFQIVGQNLMLPTSAGYAFIYNVWEPLLLPKGVQRVPYQRQHLDSHHGKVFREHGLVIICITMPHAVITVFSFLHIDQ